MDDIFEGEGRQQIWYTCAKCGSHREIFIDQFNFRTAVSCGYCRTTNYLEIPSEDQFPPKDSEYPLEITATLDESL